MPLPAGTPRADLVAERGAARATALLLRASARVRGAAARQARGPVAGHHQRVGQVLAQRRGVLTFLQEPHAAAALRLALLLLQPALARRFLLLLRDALAQVRGRPLRGNLEWITGTMCNLSSNI